MEEKKNPLAAIIAILPGVVNTVASLIKDKKKIATEAGAIGEATQPSGTQFIQEEIGKGIQLSSKRIMNIVGTGVIVTFALNDMSANGIHKANAIVLGLGVGYCVAMAIVTYLSERK